MIKKWHKFESPACASLYGYGTSHEARWFCETINSHRDSDYFVCLPLTFDSVAALGLDPDTPGLDRDLGAILEAAAWNGSKAMSPYAFAGLL